MSKLEKLTPEQEELMHATAKEWIDFFYNIKEIDRPEFEKGIAWLYNDLLNLPTPEVIYCDSWMTALETIKQYYAKEGMGEVSTKDFFNQYSNYSNTYSNFGWVSFYDFFEKIGILKNDNFTKYKAFIKAGAFQVYEYEKYVFAIQPPIKMVRNEDGQLNNVNGPAFEWSTGEVGYCINGLNVEADLFEKLSKGKYTVADFANERNEEVKSAVISFIQQKQGEEGIYRFFSENLKEIHTYVDKKEEKFLVGTTESMNIGVYTLFKGVINGFDVAYVRCYCPSTDRMFFLGVDPSNTKANDAIASLYRVPNALKNHIVSISRQGEIYSTVFDDKGNEMLKTLSETEIKNQVGVSGDFYFDKLTYEY